MRRNKLHSTSSPQVFESGTFFSPDNTLTSCRTCISLNILWEKILQRLLHKYLLAALGHWVYTWWLGVGDRWNTQLFVSLSSLWLQIRPQEMTEDCFWVKANENKYENMDLLCKLENTFCCQPKGKFNILVICYS